MASDVEDRGEVHYLLLKRLIVNIGTECLREVFNKQIQPMSLHNFLNAKQKEINNCKKNHGLTNRQERFLKPPNGPPNSETFDITLLVMLLRYMCFTSREEKELWKQNENKDIPAHNTKVVADVVRVKNVRNWIDHQSKAYVEETEFEAAWKVLEEALIRLGQHCGCDFKKKIEETKTKTVDLVPSDVRSMRELSVNYFEDFLDNQDPTFVETKQYKKAVEIMKEKNVVVFTGHPGEGKTTLATKLALSNSNMRNCLMLKQPQEWRKVDWSLKMFDTIIIDDIFGAGSLDQLLMTGWKPYLSEIERAAKQKRLRVIITSRHYIFEESKDEIIDAKIDMFKGDPEEEKVLVHLATKELSEPERKSILKSQADREGAKLSEYIIDDCVQASIGGYQLYSHRREDFAFGFPECASMFVRNPGMLEEGPLFFERPAALFKKYIEELSRGSKTKTDKFLALIAVWASEDKRLAEKDIQTVKTASQQVRKVVETFYGVDLDLDILRNMETSLKSHVGGYLEFNEKTGEYGFSHNVIGDMVGVVLGKMKSPVAIELCPRDFLMEHVSLETGGNTEYIVTVPERQYGQLAQKCANMIMRRNCNSATKQERLNEFYNLERRGPRSNEIKNIHTIDYGIIKHRAFRNEKFVHEFITYAKTEDVVNKLFDVPVMEMTGYFLDYGIKMKEMKMCLTGYAIYSKVSSLGLAVLDEKILNNDNMDSVLSLLLATHASDVDTMSKLLEREAKVTGDTLYVAAHRKDSRVLEVLVKHPGANINDKGNILNGNNTLIVASRKNMIPVLECLLRHKADPSVKNDSKLTALHKAVIYKHTDIVNRLLHYSAPLDEKGGKFKRTPLHIASDLNLEEITRLLLAKGASVKVKDHRGHYPIHLAAIRGNCKIVEMLLKHDRSQDKWRIASYGKKSFIKGMSLFHVAVWKDNKTLLSVLTGMNADPNVKDFYGRTPLNFAIAQNKTEIAKYLLQVQGVDKSMPQKQGFSPLHTAIHTGNIDIFRALVKESNVNCSDKYGRTPLHVVCEKADVAAAKSLLLSHKADPRMVTKRGDTVYHILRRKSANKSKDEQLKRMAIEKIIQHVDPQFINRLSEMPNRSGTKIQNSATHVNMMDRLKIKELVGSLSTEGGDEDPKAASTQRQITTLDDLLANIGFDDSDDYYDPADFFDDGDNGLYDVDYDDCYDDMF